MALIGFFIHPSKKLPSPLARDSTNGLMDSHAEGHNPKGAVADAVKFDAFVKVYVEGYRAYPQSRYGGNEPYTVWPEGAAKYGHTPINTNQ